MDHLTPKSHGEEVAVFRHGLVHPHARGDDVIGNREPNGSTRSVHPHARGDDVRSRHLQSATLR